MSGRIARALLAALLACGAPDDDWVAEVGGERIGIEELRARLEPRWGEEPDATREDLVLQELEALIDERVALDRARELGVEVAAGEVDRRIADLLHGEEGSSDAAFRESVRREMTIERAALLELAERIEVGESALLHHFQANPERYAEPARVEIRQILVRDEETAHKLLGELRGGADFATLAESHSLSPDARNGGLLPPFARGEMPEVFDRAFELEPGRLSEPLESPYGFHLFRVEQRMAEVPPDFETARDQIRAELEQVRLEELTREWRRQIRRTAEVQVNESALERLP